MTYDQGLFDVNHVDPMDAWKGGHHRHIISM